MTSWAPAARSLVTINEDVAVGTTTVQSRLRARAEWTAARPAFPPDEA